MTWDIVFPHKNEAQFVELAEKLGYAGLVCVYPKGQPHLPETKLTLKLNKHIKPGGEKTRNLIERRGADIIYDLEKTKKDYVHHRGSGLNHILANLMHKKGVAAGFSFSSLLHATPWKRSQLIGRMQQNVKLCRKYNVPMVIGSFATRPYELRAPHDLKAFFCDIGVHPREVDEGRKLLGTFK